MLLLRPLPLEKLLLLLRELLTELELREGIDVVLTLRVGVLPVELLTLRVAVEGRVAAAALELRVAAEGRLTVLASVRRLDAAAPVLRVAVVAPVLRVAAVALLLRLAAVVLAPRVAAVCWLPNVRDSEPVRADTFLTAA